MLRINGVEVSIMLGGLHATIVVRNNDFPKTEGKREHTFSFSDLPPAVKEAIVDWVDYT